MPNTTHGYYVLGWLAKLRYDPLANLYEAWVPQHPQVLTIGKSRQ